MQNPMQINPYLNFNGQCEAAFKFYEQCLGGKIVAIIPHAGSNMPPGMPAEWDEKILHARLMVGDQTLMGSDAPPSCYEKPRGFSVSLNVNTPEEAERIFAALVEGGSVDMPIQETFWAVRFGMAVDQFGIPWMINCEKAN
jgi:PhnB protein